MRNYLLAGASALALTVSAGAAFADTAPGKFDIKISGDAFVEGSIVGTDRDSSSRTFSIAERFRLNVMPQATADNGLTYGARARIRANSSAATIDGDRSYVFVKGNFGEVWAGTTDGVSSEFYAGSLTWDWQVLANNDEWKRHLPGTTTSGASTYGQLSSMAWGQWGAPGVNGVQLLQSNSAANRVNYWTPRWSGLQGGVTYVPKLGSALTGVDRSNLNGASVSTSNSAQQTTNFQDVYELTVNYVNKFDNGFGIKGIAGYTGGTAAADAVGGIGYRDLESFNVAARLSYMDFEIGGGYVWGGKSGYTKAAYVTGAGATATGTSATAIAGSATNKASDQDSWTVGGQYTWGPMIFGISYQEQTDAGNVGWSGNRTLDFISAGITYNVAPGLQAAIEYTHFENTSDVPATAATPTKDAGNIVLVRSIVKF